VTGSALTLTLSPPRTGERETAISSLAGHDGMKRLHILCRAALLLPVAAAACRTADPKGEAPLVQPGAPGQPTRPISAARAVRASTASFTDADVRFMQGMITHHAQALEMVALVPSRTGREGLKLLAERIRLSQADEIALMRQWLEARGRTAPDLHAHHAHDAALMPGMLTPVEMARLADATGAVFDRLFFEGMIKHHEGALTMVEQLFATHAAGQESEIFAFASDVDADQRMEIQRMRRLLAEQ
jgi:uncharacterized protein (DUF305 family)